MLTSQFDLTFPKALKSKLIPHGVTKGPGFVLSLLPIVMLLASLVGIIIFKGSGAIADYSHWALLAAASLAIILSFATGTLGQRGLIVGFRRSARQIMPAVPMLIFIAMVSTTWMLSGVVPTLIDYGLQLLSPKTFLFVSCAVCSVISVLTGSSWSTIATIGVAFMGIGTVMGFNPGWVAGAIISGAYFGDKISPLSDTTVVASSACGVDLFKHIRYLMFTTAPAMTIALLCFLIAGLSINPEAAIESGEITTALHEHFVITPWTLLIPLITMTLIVMRINTQFTLFISSMLGLAGIFLFQPGIVAILGGGSVPMVANLLWNPVEFNTGFATFDNLVSTGGITGMLPTVALVLCAMMFGTAMIATGMLTTITATLMKGLRTRFTIVASNVGAGLFINSCTADQYLSIIIAGNMFRNVYRRAGLEPRLLSRTVEDSVSVTSVIIPWNSCGVTQSTILGVATLTYLPYCIFNWLSPLMSLLLAYTGFRIKQHRSIDKPSKKR